MIAMEFLSSFRPVIIQKVSTFSVFFKAESKAVADILTETVIHVSNSREEGVPFAPVVFIADDLDDLLKTVSGTNPILIGEGPLDANTALVAFKSCVPLGEGRQWVIYMIIGSSKLSYGVFCTERSPLKVTSFEALRLQSDPVRPLIGVTRIGQAIVEIRGGGLLQYLDFLGVAELRNTFPGVVRSFISNITKDVPLEFKRQFEAFYYRIAVEITNSSHGALVAVIKNSSSAIPEILADGIWLTQPIEIGNHIKNHSPESSANDALALIAYGSLIRQMIAMDGITVFSSDGSLIAYNCFIRQQLECAPSKAVLGGARKRAFHILCESLGKPFTAVLYRSQDGESEYRQLKN